MRVLFQFRGGAAVNSVCGVKQPQSLELQRQDDTVSDETRRSD